MAAGLFELDDVPAGDPTRVKLQKISARWHQNLLGLCDEAVSTGEFKPDLDKEQFVFEMYGIYLSHHVEFRFNKNPQADERAKRAFAPRLIAFCLAYPVARGAVLLNAVPKEFPPFTALPILSGVVIAPMVAASIYASIKLTNPTDPDRIFFFVTLAFFALSFGLPLRLSFTQSARFAGVIPQAQMILVLLHAIVAVCTFLALTYRTKIN